MNEAIVPWTEEIFQQYQGNRVIEIESGPRKPRADDMRRSTYNYRPIAAKLRAANPGMTSKQSVVQAREERSLDIQYWHRNRYNRRAARAAAVSVIPAEGATAVAIPGRAARAAAEAAEEAAEAAAAIPAGEASLTGGFPPQANISRGGLLVPIPMVLVMPPPVMPIRRPPMNPLVGVVGVAGVMGWRIWRYFFETE